VSELTIRFESTEVSDIEVAAVTVAVAGLTARAAAPGGAAGPGGADATHGRGPGTGAPAWRAAALLEATDGRRLGSLASLRDALGNPG
jgi:hypothetical protein